MGRSKKGKNKDVHSEIGEISVIDDVGLKVVEDSEPAAAVLEWLGDPQIATVSYILVWSLNDAIERQLLPPGGPVLRPRLESVQDCSGSWGDSRLLLPPLSIYDAHLLTQQHVLVSSCCQLVFQIFSQSLIGNVWHCIRRWAYLGITRRGSLSRPAMLQTSLVTQKALWPTFGTRSHSCTGCPCKRFQNLSMLGALWCQRRCSRAQSCSRVQQYCPPASLHLWGGLP